MPETPYANLHDDELLGLHGSIALILAEAEPLLAARRISADAWVLVTEALREQHEKTGLVLEARGLDTFIEPVITPKEAAERAGVSVATVSRYLMTGWWRGRQEANGRWLVFLNQDLVPKGRGKRR